MRNMTVLNTKGVYGAMTLDRQWKFIGICSLAYALMLVFVVFSLPAWAAELTDVNSSLQVYDVESGTWTSKSGDQETVSEGEVQVSYDVVADPELDTTEVTTDADGAYARTGDRAEALLLLSICLASVGLVLIATSAKPCAQGIGR